MTKSSTNPKADRYFKSAKRWQEEMEKLRAIVLSCPLTEELKWGKPCYTFEGKNIVLIIGFKEYCSLLLGKGALLKDPKGILVKAGENTQAARQIRFTDLGQITKLAPTLKAYLQEAIAAEKAGLEVTYKKITEFAIPEELQARFDEQPAFKKAFQSLTAGRQRAYLIHFSGAKQSATRTARIEKCIPQILDGKGMND
ncbi:protein of unknown function DUF1801 [Chthoniobacter flavus Ellin428]|uniref:YdhG-like domain-containing protein n=1 Tax=Chthoniobacter flavus Ellin428 TaxID=497964 RepID=B4D698_9BACT|nr:DUF1801 domain-containing protein [Chthoniobacter flavus]EDY18007.1 protein of unknown function DUF1801 [Chthoniobacter flavus Ellin428]TCO88249.1 uncharacterized protein YdeI (YjbR/CyaY-like superfamily) [Chthoniobacter flavus]